MMEKVLKWSMYSLGALSLIVIGAIAWFVFSGFQSGGNSITEEQEQVMKEVNEPTEQKEIKAVAEDGTPSEGAFMQALHEMTHQKVKANRKRGSQQITAEQIDRMLGILKSVEETKDHYEHFKFYKKSLEAWDEGDFSNAMTVHNTIWGWQDGEVGRATGLMSEDEEREYIKRNF
ncbi:DUF6241 domain-containing protein [Halobacillus litoralis]|uniref:DUF6241 domain-containing protein n=1 Tax=Halobacillus litoralis TaxID=45668 RepID=UPI001CFCBD03|nr:DUF6241 domain-containing protein [Halobacillus litoralis]